MLTRAQYYKKVGEDVVCLLCPHKCRIGKGHRGICGARENRGGELYSLSDGYVTALAYDSIKKKPLSFFGEGEILSMGSFGCNFHCDFCQNYRLLDSDVDKKKIDDSEILELAKPSMGLAYTYNEPTVNFEMAKRLAGKIKDQGQLNVMVTNGYIDASPREELLGLIDAWSIDYKMPAELYPSVCGGREEVVLETIARAWERTHVEVTILLIPGRNTQEEVLRGMLEKLSAIDRNIPLHLSRYFPCYKSNIPTTALETMYRSYELALDYMDRVVLGNMPMRF